MQDKMPDMKPPEYANNPVPPYQQPPQQYYPGTQPVYYPVYVTRHKVPGKGFGITSMILGIFGLIYSSMLFFISLLSMLYSFANPFYNNADIHNNMKLVIGNLFESDSMENVMALVFVSLVLAVLACVFAVISRNKGYRNKISRSGLILSIVTFAVIFVFIEFMVFVFSGF